MTEITSVNTPGQDLLTPDLPPAGQDAPVRGPKGPRTPYPVDEPPDPKGPGSQPDYLPGQPDNPNPRF